MAPTTRRSGRANHQDGGIPLPPGNNDFYGENNEIVPVRGGNQETIAEDDNNNKNTELYNETFSLSRGQRRSQIAGQTTDPIGEAFNNISKPTMKAPDFRGSYQDSSQDTFVPTGTSRAALPKDLQPFNEGDPWNLRDEPGNRNLYRTNLQNPYETPHSGRRHPFEPPNSLASKWGMASGRPSPYPLSTRSFIQEDQLYDLADIQAPSIQPPPKRSSQQRKSNQNDPPLRDNGNESNSRHNPQNGNNQTNSSPPSRDNNNQNQPSYPQLPPGDITQNLQTSPQETQNRLPPSPLDHSNQGHVLQPSKENNNPKNQRQASQERSPISLPHGNQSPASGDQGSQTMRRRISALQAPSSVASARPQPPVAGISIVEPSGQNEGAEPQARKESIRGSKGGEGHTNPPLEPESRSRTSMNDPTEAQKARAGEVQQRMPVVEETVRGADAWQKQQPPKHSPIDRRDPVIDRSPDAATPATSARTGILSGNKSTSGSVRNNQTNPGTEGRTVSEVNLSTGGKNDGHVGDDSQTLDDSRNNEPTARTRISQNDSGNNRTDGGRNRQTNQAPRRQDSKKNGGLQSDHGVPLTPLTPLGSSGSRLSSTIRNPGLWAKDAPKTRFWLWTSVFAIVTVLLASQYGPSIMPSGSLGGFSIPQSNFSLPLWGGCCADARLKEVFSRLDGIDLDLGRIHTILDALKAGVRPANDGRQIFWVEQDKNGKLVIPQDYYEAIKQQILKDKELLKGVTTETWSPVISRLVADGYLQNRPDGKYPDYEEVTHDDINNAWNLWLRQNDATIVRALHGVLNRTISEHTEKELKELLARRNIDLSGGQLVTRKEFEELYKKEIRGGYSGKLRELADQVDEYKKSLEELKVNPPNGVSKEGVAKVVEAAVKKYTDALKIEAAAKSGSSAMLTRLASQVNYFTTGAGAVVDPHFTSEKWKPPKPVFKSKQWYDRDGYTPKPPIVALLPWEEEGECFCAGPNRQREGAGTANLSVMISRDIVPQVVVVEHMLPGATLDPGARPKDIEIWAAYEDYELKRTVEAWSRARWPTTISEKALHSGFVKIGDFKYEDQRVGDGTQVFKLSSDLVDMDAAASVFVIRALNNYGADHTCFYRIRLYGEQRERDLSN